MHKIKGWTKQSFKGCTICRHVKKRIVCQATYREYSTLYCQQCRDEEMAKREPDDYEYMKTRDWYNASSARHYI